MSEIRIRGDIGPSWWDEGITDEWVQAQLDAMGDIDELTVSINSYGGDVFHGLAIYNILKDHPARITVKVDAIAASIASIIAMAGDEIQLGTGAMMMIHDPWTIALGNSNDLLKQAEVLEQIKVSLVDVYQAKTGLDGAELSEMMTFETWLTAKEAIDKGFATQNTGESTPAVLNKSKPWINKAPEKLQQSAAPQPEQPKVAGTPLKIAAKARLLDL